MIPNCGIFCRNFRDATFRDCLSLLRKFIIFNCINDCRNLVISNEESAIMNYSKLWSFW